MTENEINELKEFLQKKISILGPKKIKGLIKVEIVDVTFTPSYFKDDGGSLDITIEADFDNDNIVDFSVISDRVRKTGNFVRNLVSAVEPNKKCYVFWR